MQGGAVVENCGLLAEDGSYWWYPNQTGKLLLTGGCQTLIDAASCRRRSIVRRVYEWCRRNVGLGSVFRERFVY